MSHETHNDAGHEQAKSIVSFKSSFWLVVIIVGLFIAALNFIQVMSKGEEGEKKEAKTEAPAGEGKNEAAKEAEKPATTEAAKPAEAPKTEDKSATAAPAEKK